MGYHLWRVALDQLFVASLGHDTWAYADYDFERLWRRFFCPRQAFSFFWETENLSSVFSLRINPFTIRFELKPQSLRGFDCFRVEVANLLVNGRLNDIEDRCEVGV